MPTKNDAAKTFKANDIIMRQGDEGDSAYIIESGRVEIIIQNTDGSEQIVGTRGEGTIIGEMALIDRAARTATIRATEDCRLLEITHDDFMQRLDKSDPILKMTTRVILTRYRDMLSRLGVSGVDDFTSFAEDMELAFAHSTSAVEAVKIENDFKSALKNGDITLYYQPIVDLSLNRIAGFEALMRWIDQDGNMISPGVFIPIIEASGFITEASKWALDYALKSLQRIHTETNDHNLFASVNFSAHDFVSEDFVSYVSDTLINSSIKPELLHLEITERLLMVQPDIAKKSLEACRDIGMQISIDDFGTGFSSLSYLHSFPIDILKIDRAFIATMLNEEKVSALVKTIINLSDSMQFKSIAEGVEQREEAIKLKALGCDLAQGYYFAKPMPEDEFIAFVQSNPEFET